MPQNKGTDGATAASGGIRPRRQPHRHHLSHCSGKEGGKGGRGGVWVRWQEVEGGPVGLLLSPQGRREDQEPSRLLRCLVRWGGGGLPVENTPGEMGPREWTEEPFEQLANVVDFSPSKNRQM